MFDPKINVDGDFEIITNRDLNNLYNEPYIMRILKSHRVSWTRHVRRAEDQLMQNTEQKKDRDIT